jgi:hypothetical protein
MDVTLTMQLAADTELLEFVCNENEKFEALDRKIVWIEAVRLTTTWSRHSWRILMKTFASTGFSGLPSGESAASLNRWRATRNRPAERRSFMPPSR